MNARKYFLAWSFLSYATALYAGQSLVLTPGNREAMNDPNLSQTQDWRVEFQMHNWALPTIDTYDAFVWDLNGIGANLAVLSDNSLRIIDKRDTVQGGSPCQLSLNGRTNVLVRVQREYSNSRFVCEIWNSDGSGYAQTVKLIQSPNFWPYQDGVFGSAYTTANLAFFRIYMTTVVDASRPPITSDVADWTDLTFDESVLDDSGNGHNLSFPAAIFLPTPSQLPAAIIKTLNAPFWSNTTSVRAGFPVTLDGRNSFSMADHSSVLTYSWQQVYGPRNVLWSAGNSSATPTVSGLIFGEYKFRLQVTDAFGNTATTDQVIGAVATDDKGIVINADPRVDAILGPMIAYGKHPWSYIDYSHQFLSHYWSSFYDVNGGPWSLESDLTSVGGVPRLGTVTTSSDGAHFYGVGTNFLAVFCGGVGGPAVGGGYIVPHVNQGTNVPYLSHPRIIGACNSDTDVTVAGGWNYDFAQITSPVPWGTYGFCSTCGNWAGANNTTSNINYYDHGIANYALYYRSGLTAPKIAAEWMADRWIHAPMAHYGSPRDLNLVGSAIRAALDPPADGTQLWPPIRSLQSAFCSNNHTIGDPREDGWCLAYFAASALLDTGGNQTAAQAWLVAAYNNMWGPQQQADGSYITNQFEGDGTHSFIATTGSNVMTLHTGTPLPKSYCGEDTVQASGGDMTVGLDRLTVTGVNTSFLMSEVKPGMVIVMTGNFNGQPWTMQAIVASVQSNISLTLGEPWRGDSSSPIRGYRIYNSSINGTGYYSQGFGPVDSNGNLTVVAPDTDNWYWCKVNPGGSSITLDKPYTGNTSVGNIYRRLETFDTPGRGTQPYMVGISAWGEYMAAQALETYAPITAANYRAAANRAAAWLYNTARDTVTDGLWYAMGFANCRAIVFPSFGCSAVNVAQSRDYGVEADNVLSQLYLEESSAVDRYGVDLFFTHQYAAPGFSSPIASDGTTVDLLECCDVFTRTKYYAQAFSVGQAYKWPAARLGGTSPAQIVTFPLSIPVATKPGVARALVVVTQPSGAASTVSCTQSPCSVSLDRRQGTHWVQISYVNGNGVIVSKSAPQLVDPSALP